MLSSFRVSWRNLTKNKKRFLFTLSAIVLGIIVMTGMLIVKETTSKSLEYYEKLYAGEADFFVQSTDRFYREEDIDWLTQHPSIEKNIFALLKHGFVEIDTLNKAQASVRISGISHFDNGLLEFPVLQGDLSKEGLVITENAAKLWGKKLGDSVSFTNMGSLNITAIVEEGAMLNSPEDIEEANFRHARVMIPLHILQKWTGFDGQITDYRFKVKDDVNHATLLAELQTQLKDSPLYVQPIVIDNRQNNDVDGLYLVFDLIAILSIFISGFIAFNMIYATMIERRKEFAIMKSLGYTTRKIYRLIFHEIGLLAALGTIIALPIGIWFGNVFQDLLLSAVATQDVTYALEIKSPLLISGIVGIFFPFVATSFPIYVAGKIPVMEAIVKHPNSSPRNKGVGVLRLVLGVILTAFGFINHSLAFLLLFVGLVFLYPLLMRVILLVLTPLWEIIFKYPGKQAMQSIQQFKNRNANTSAMLAVGVSLALFMSALLISLPDGIESETSQLFGGDIHVTKETPWNAEDIKSIQDLEEVQDVYLFSEVPQITWKTKDDAYRQFSILGFPGQADQAKMFRIMEEVNNPSNIPNLYLGKRALSEWGGKIGETIILNTPSGEQEFFIKALIESIHYSDYVAFLDEKDLANVLQWPYKYTIAISSDSEVGQTRIIEHIWQTFGNNIESVSTATMFAEKSKQALTGMEDLFHGLLLLVILLSAIGISNTLFMNIIERTKEIGMMRAIGFTKKQVRHMIIAEGLIIGFVGVIVGILYGILVIYLNAQTEKELLYFTVPINSLILAILGGLIFTLFATWLPTITASRVSVKEAIFHE